MDNGTNKNNSSITKYQGATILSIPSKKYPDMVHIIKTSKKLNRFLNKKYISMEKAMVTIDLIDTDRLISTNRIRATRDLVDLGLSDNTY